MKTCPQCQIKYPDVLEFCPRDGTALPGTPGKDPTYDPILDTTIDGRYAIESRLGEGGMGVVYKARHVLIDKPVAIKILRKEAAQDTASVQRFIQEAKSASKINHSNIVDITDFGVLADGHAYFVMEFLQGPTLAQAIQEGPLDAARVCSIGAQMARGLYAAHTKGIVHRDLKPENIFLLEREGQKDFVKIVDFGIAKVGGGQKLTQVGMVLGTPEYMSPEQATGQETDHRVDQYAVGCIMYEMLTGVVPFLGDRPAQTLTKHVFEPVIPPRKRKPELDTPATLEAVVLRTMAKKPEQRFPSMRDLELALGQVDSELKSGRVVIEETRITAANSGQMQQLAAAPASPATPPPSPYMQPGQPGQPAAGLPGPSSGYPVAPGMPAGYPGQALPQPIAPGFASGPVLAAGPGQVRPTRESPPVKKNQRVRAVLAAIAGALIVVIALLVYFLFSQDPTRNLPPPPKVDSTPKVDLLPPKVDSSPIPSPPELAAPVPVTLTIATRPPGADVVVDGEAKGQTPLRLPHKSGVLLHMELRKKGYEPYSEDLQPEKDLNVDIKLDKEQRGKRPGGNKTSKPGGRPPGQPGKPPGRLPSELRDPFKHK